MKRLDLYILKSFLGPLFMTFFIVLFVLIILLDWLHFDFHLNFDL